MTVGDQPARSDHPAEGGDATSGTPVTAVSSADHKVYAVAAGNHVTVELDRAMTGELPDVIEVLVEAPRLGERTMLCRERMAPTMRKPRSALTQGRSEQWWK